MNYSKNVQLLLVFIIFTALSHPVLAQAVDSNWKSELKEQLQLFGHRNWILVVDAAYPLQSNPAVKTVVTGADHLEVIAEVLAAAEKAPHVTPEIYLDTEIDYVPGEEAPGMERFRSQLQQMLRDKKVEKVLHEKMIAQIDEAAELYQVLVLKTNFLIPYSSVFINLNCGYWTTEQEEKMRELMPD
ncbi:RbsD / FucU transport protein family protein [Tangfeifania diversioriginum]|uniref:D-ribose pyranase n=1 Tax=Tangfeifania diversioriginum TaxID=1168035 RepID=A0A1M6BH12_9BACT|nr:RbsD/FucU domain-containing protein [Tangfeifania diversioriginum]SHI48060.1 RbsD / FucU transport protein family protein [Tangfeifania diversioriginum]